MHKHILAALSTVIIVAAACIFFIVPTLASEENHTYSNKEAGDSVRRVSIIFAGDLMQHLPQIEAAKTGNGYDYQECFVHIAPIFKEADITVVNLETTLSEIPPYSGYPMFCAPGQLARDMKQAGMDVALLANNHICDKGSEGIARTVNILDGAGILHTGAFSNEARYGLENPLTIYRNGFDIHIMNYTYGTNGISIPAGRIVNLIDTLAIGRDLERVVRTENSLVFVCLHWGDEYQTKQSPQQEKLAAWLNSKGANLIIGGHPHVVQPIKTQKDSLGHITGLTAYSLGNFISNQQKKNTDGGMALKINVSKRTGEKAVIEPSLFYVWTYKHVSDRGVKYYTIPSFHADSLLSADRAAVKKHRHFIDNARRISNSEGIVAEITEF